MATEMKLLTVPASGRWSSILDVAIAVFLEARVQFKSNEGVGSLPEYLEASSLLHSVLEEEFSDVDDTRCHSAVTWVTLALGDVQDGREAN